MLGKSFFSIVNDQNVAAYFPHRLLPHYVWISSSGIVQAFTSVDDVNVANIQTALKDFAVLAPVFNRCSFLYWARDKVHAPAICNIPARAEDLPLTSRSELLFYFSTSSIRPIPEERIKLLNESIGRLTPDNKFYQKIKNVS